MKAHWRKLLSFLPADTERKFYKFFFRKEHNKWLKKGKPLPVSNYSKQEALREFQKKYSLKILIETGTYLGDTLYSLVKDFEQLFSIELSKHFYEKAQGRFKGFDNINLLQGDSGKVLKELIPKLQSPALFWLDGHYSGGLTAKGDKECPVYEELHSIFSSPYDHVIFIDDARLFNGQNDYPAINELRSFVKKQKPTYKFLLVNDCIRLLP